MSPVRRPSHRQQPGLQARGRRRRHEAAASGAINLLGEYNIGGDAFLIEDLFERCGIDLVATFSGNSTYDQFANAAHGRV